MKMLHERKCGKFNSFYFLIRGWGLFKLVSGSNKSI